MRYLKRFSETLDESLINEWNTNDIIQTIKDILLPISDMGYEISVVLDDELGLIIRVVSWGDKPLLITDEVKEEFIRMKDYLQSEGYNSIQALYHPTHHLVLKTDGVGIMGNSGREIKEFDSFMKYESWQKVKIQNLLFVAK
jgi:hypothetical protein